LAFGVNLPARMVVIQDYKRYEAGLGHYPISVLEYKQMAGRAGRPKYDRNGEAVLLASTEDEREYLMKRYVFARPERIWSRLAVEKIMRSHVLSTVAAGYAHTVQGVNEFFGRTFYACQYPMGDIKNIIAKILKYLYDEDMIDAAGEDVFATPFGKRVSDLYIDPVSGVMIRSALKRSEFTDLGLLHLAVHTPDMGPSVRVFSKERDDLSLFVEEHRKEFLTDVPDEWRDPEEYDFFLGEVKTAKVLNSWIGELTEDEIIGQFGVQPGDLYRIVETAKWLLYATHELAVLFRKYNAMPKTLDLMLRIEKGVRRELLPLVKLGGVGRIRGRILYNAGYRTIADLRNAEADALAKLPMIGDKLAQRIKQQIHSQKEEPPAEETPKQRTLADYDGSV